MDRSHIGLPNVSLAATEALLPSRQGYEHRHLERTDFQPGFLPTLSPTRAFFNLSLTTNIPREENTRMMSTDPIYFHFPVWMLYQSVPAGQLNSLFFDYTYLRCIRPAANCSTDLTASSSLQDFRLAVALPLFPPPRRPFRIAGTAFHGPHPPASHANLLPA